jgi:hypothetical protein
MTDQNDATPDPLAAHCDALEEAVQQYEDGLQASAAACAKMNTSIQATKPWVYAFAGTQALGLLLTAVLALNLLTR